jgi:hypothetical protein
VLYEAIGGNVSIGPPIALTDLDTRGTGVANGVTIAFGLYWSSTEYSSDDAYYFYFGDGSRYTDGKTFTRLFRCVRSL